jgi:hypothetical protein
MYSTRALEVENGKEPAQAPLYQQLERDRTGELRDRWLGELQAASSVVEAALAAGPPAEKEEVLRNLLEAMRTGEHVLLDVWSALHG